MGDQDFKVQNGRSKEKEFSYNVKDEETVEICLKVDRLFSKRFNENI